MRRILLSGLLVGAIVLAQASASTDPCNKTLSPSPVVGQDGYSQRASGERCEGIYISTVAARPLELVSLMRGRLSYDVTHPVVLLVTLDTPPPDGVTHLLAVGIPEGLYYQMDADVEGDHILKWPVNDVLATPRRMIDPNDVGVLAFHRNASSERIYLPVDVFPAGTAPARGEAIVAVVRAINMTDLKYRFVWKTQKTPTNYSSALVKGDRAEITLSEENGPIAGTLEVRGTDTLNGEIKSNTFLIGN
jgi:hypothetical protein